MPQPQQQPIMGPDQVRATLNDALSKVQAGQLTGDAFVDCICLILVNQAATDVKLVETCRKLNERIKALEGLPEAPAASAPHVSGATPPQAVQRAPQAQGGVRLDMNGNPMSPEEAAVEASMDAAIEEGRKTGEAS